MHETETLVSLWNTWIRYDWRALTVTGDAMYLTYPGQLHRVGTLVVSEWQGRLAVGEHEQGFHLCQIPAPERLITKRA